MRHLITCTWLAFAVLSSGCPAHGPLSPDALLARHTAPATRAMLEAAGSDTCVTVIVNPGQWQAVKKTLVPILSGLVTELDQVLAADDMAQAVQCLLAGAEPSRAELDGWDLERPIVAGLFEPHLNDVVLAARVLIPDMDLFMKQGVAGIRHRVLIPAIDRHVLADKLAKLLAALGLHQLPPDASHAGKRIFAFGRKDGFVAVVETQGESPSRRRDAFVRLEILTNERIPYASREDRLSAWFGMLGENTGKGPGPVTPALLAATGRPELLSIYVRPWVLRDLAAQYGTGQVLEAATVSDPSFQAMLLARGLSMVANSYLLLSPAGAELEDFCLTLSVSDGLRLGFVAGLTGSGQRIFEAGRAGAVEPLGVPDGPLPLALWSRLDINAMIQAAAIPPELSGVNEVRELGQVFAECGPFCPLYYMARNPFGLARTLLDIAPENLHGQLPRALNMAIADFDPHDNAVPLRLALAAQLPAGANTRLLRKGLALFDRHSGPSMRSQLYVEPKGDTQLVQIGLGIDPRQVFEGQREKSPAEVLGEMQIDMADLANLVASENTRAAAILDRLGPIRSRATLAPRTLHSELLVDIKGKKSLAYRPALDTRGIEWQSPGVAETDTRGARCMHKVTRSMIEAFSALASADPRQRSLLLAKLIEELAEPLACARKEPDTAEQASRTQLMLTLYVADRLAEELHPEAERTLVQAACKQGLGPACKRLEEIGSRPAVEPAEVAGDCSFIAPGGRPVIRIPESEEIGVAGSLEEQLRPGKPSPALFADARAPYERVAAVLEEVAAARDDVQIIVKSEKRGYQGINADLARPGADSARESKDESERLVKLEHFASVAEADHPLVLKVSGKTIELAADGSIQAFRASRDCGRETSCMGLDELGQELARLRKNLGEGCRIYLDASANTRFASIARVLAVAACDTRQGPFGGGKHPPVILGPVEQKTWNRAAMARVSASDSQDSKTGILAILGSNSKDSFIGSVGIGGAGIDGALSDIEKKGKAPKIKPGKADVIGSLDKNVIRRVIRKNINQVKYCYEKELVKNPGLGGKVVIRLVIAADGRVQKAEVKSTTMNNKIVEKCIAWAVRRFKFPKPKGGGLVIVNYPFIFKSQ